MDRSEYDKDYYKNNTEKRKASNKKNKLRVKAWYRKYKSKLKCIKCGEKHIECLEFHHIGKKKMVISNMVANGYGIETIKKEMVKCIVLCANCHRKEHFLE